MTGGVGEINLVQTYYMETGILLQTRHRLIRIHGTQNALYVCEQGNKLNTAMKQKML